LGLERTSKPVPEQRSMCDEKARGENSAEKAFKMLAELGGDCHMSGLEAKPGKRTTAPAKRGWVYS